MGWFSDLTGIKTPSFISNAGQSVRKTVDQAIRAIPSSRDQATRAGLTAVGIGALGYGGYQAGLFGGGAGSGIAYPVSAEGAGGGIPALSDVVEAGAPAAAPGAVGVPSAAAGGFGTAVGTLGESGIPFAAAAPGIDLGITAPAFTSSPQLTATGVSGSGLPVGTLPSSSAFPAYQGPFSGDFGGPTDTGPLASRLPAGGGLKEAPTLANKFLNSGVGNFAAKYGLPLAALGTQLLGRPKIPEMGALSGRAAAMEKAGQEDIASARAGNLTPAQQAGIDKFKSDQMSAVKQYMANSGQGMDSTSFLQLKANVDQQALAMSQGFLDQLMSQGLNELGLADSAEAQLINIRLQREQETSAAFGNFMMTFGLLNGWGGTGRG
jgi:hypothetical protein